MPKKSSFEELREKMLKSAKEGVKSSYTNEEHALMQAINAYLETSKSYNLLYERLTEWYGLYYPEIRVGSPKTLADLTLALNLRSKATKEAINSAINDEQRSASLFEKASNSIGREMNDDEMKAITGFAKLSKEIAMQLEEFERYVSQASHKIMPNVSHLVDEKIAAELLSKAGSLERFATMPASTVQLLGAEKSLFKHIKFGSKPPKYGVLFKLPAIANAPRDKRGRIARIYATKICIAIKGDYFSKKFIADKLKESLDVAVKRAMESPSRPKPKGGFEHQRAPRRFGQHRPQGGRFQNNRRENGDRNQFNRRFGGKPRRFQHTR